MSDLFSHEEKDSDVAVKKNQPPSGVIFLEPARSAAQDAALDSPRRSGPPDFA